MNCVVLDTNRFDQRPSGQPSVCVWSELSGRVGYLEKKVPKVQRPEVTESCAFSSQKISKKKWLHDPGSVGFLMDFVDVIFIT